MWHLKVSNGLSIKNDKMANDKFYEFLLSAFKNMAAHLEKGGSAYVFHADTEGLNLERLSWMQAFIYPAAAFG